MSRKNKSRLFCARLTPVRTAAYYIACCRGDRSLSHSLIAVGRVHQDRTGQIHRVTAAILRYSTRQIGHRTGRHITSAEALVVPLVTAYIGNHVPEAISDTATLDGVDIDAVDRDCDGATYTGKRRNEQHRKNDGGHGGGREREKEGIMSVIAMMHGLLRTNRQVK